MKRSVKKVLFFSGAILGVVFALCVWYAAPVRAEVIAGDLPVIRVYNNEGEPINISLEDAGKYHGDICPCLVFTYRAIQSAVERLWEGEIPYRSDMRMITRSKSCGARDAFEFVARAVTRPERKGDFRIEPPEEKKPNMEINDFVFIFIRKSTNDRLEVRVKDSVFPEGFLRMKKKRESGLLTPREKEMFNKAKLELKRKAVSLPPEELFTFKEIKK
ncbi:MAG: FmdE family protein [Candidatus Omnitrophota bacterium]|nr:FmdE family protein [Candidatus Omnitrophota bacterium]